MKRILCLMLLVLSSLVITSAKTTPVSSSRINAAVPATPAPATENDFDLRDFGAVGDGVTNDGPALQNALNAIAAAGGGTLFVPAGRYAIATPVTKDFSGLASSVTIRGVASSTPVITKGTGEQLSRGLDLTSEFVIMTGNPTTALTLRGLNSLLITEMVFIGVPGVPTDARIALALYGIGEATVRHCEFYGLSTVTEAGAVLHASGSSLNIDQTVFLGCTGNSAIRNSVVLNTEWKKVSVTESVFLDYGTRPNFFSKTGLGTPYSWIMIGNAAPVNSLSPRRDATIRNIFLDEGGYFGITSIPDYYNPPGPAADLIYVSDLVMNVNNLGSSGIHIARAQHVLIERASFEWTHDADAAVTLFNVGDAILDGLSCIAAVNRIRASSSVGKLTVINSGCTNVESQAQVTNIITTSPEDDPVQYVRQQYLSALGPEPEGAGIYYWSRLLLACGNDQACVTQRRAELANFLGSKVNVALSSNGGTAVASSYFSNPNYGIYLPSYVNDGSRRAVNGAIWLDNTATNFPDWIEVDFSGSKTITEIGVVTQQDTYQNPVEPTLTQNFSLYGITAYEVQYWNGSLWVTVPGGSVTGNDKVWRKFTFPSITTSKIRVLINDGADHAFSRVVEVEAWALSPPPSLTNIALSSNGGTAVASSYFSNPSHGTNLPSYVNDGSRRAVNGAVWLDNTATNFPDWIEIDFSGNKTITEIDVVTQQDTYQNPVEPALMQTFSLYGITAYEVQYWNGSLWVTVPGGSVTGNDNVWRKFTFPSITTSKIRVLINDGADHVFSRVVEVEAWALAPPPSPTNIALSSNGGTAVASSYLSNPSYGTFLPSYVNDGSRRAVNGAIWLDNTASNFPDWIEVDFGASRTINEIDVVTQQDTYQNPVEPTLTQTFSLYGITAYQVQYWNGSLWVTVSGGSVTGNNKVWRQFTFPSITTSKIRVFINDGADHALSRVVEVEAWTAP